MRRYILYMAISLALIAGFVSCEPFLQKDISKLSIELNAPQHDDTLTGIVSFWWNEIEKGTKYRLQVVAPDFNAPSQLLLDTVVMGYTYSLQLPAGEYQWRVRGENANSETPYSTRTFFVVTSQDLTTQSVVLREPNNNKAFSDSAIFFSWYGIATANSYHFQVTDSAGSILFQQTIEDDSITVVFTEEGYYIWKVKALNGVTETVYSSRSFYYDKTSPAQPANTFPTYGDTVNAGPVLLQWNRGVDIGSPITDSIFVFSDSLNTLSGIYYSQAASYSLTTVPGTYYWRVRSRDLAGNVSPYSVPFKFIAE